MPRQIDQKKSSSISLNHRQKSKSATNVFKQSSTINLNADQWLLPETEEYLRRNSKTQKSISTIVNEEQEGESVVLIRKVARTPFGEVKSYLKKNSLVAQRLTILDVVYPASVPVKEPQHIQVIDRYVLAKVWDDLFPFTYGSYSNKFRLVNHYAIDLEKYEAKLKVLITEYYQFTSKFIWKCLDDEQKLKLGPQLYWLLLSTDEQYKYAREITKEENKDQSALEFFVWRKLTKVEQNNVLQKPALYHEKTQEILKIALQNAKAESALDGVTRMDVEIKRATKFLQISTDLRRYQKRADNESKKSHDPVPSKPPIVRYIIGTRVICLYDGDGYFYFGTIQRNHAGQLIVLFDMDIEQIITGHILLPANSNNLLNLFIQDYVLVRQMRETEEYWAPAVILALPSPTALPPNLYRIKIYDPSPREIFVHRKDMIRTTLNLFRRSVLYLQNINRISGTNGVVITRPPGTPSLTENELQGILHELLDPLTEEVERMSQLHTERFNQLLRALEDLIRAIRLLQEGSNKPPVKYEYAQTEEIRIHTNGSTRRSSDSTVLEPHTPVYAVWLEDDALIYEGTVVKSIGSNDYIVERKDLPGVTSNISRNNIFLKSDRCELKSIDVESFALVKYPDSRHCFCPSLILRHHQREAKTKVRFYDCYDEDISNTELVIPINKHQFACYTSARIEKEKSLINQPIVGLNNNANLFMLGEVKNRTETGHQYFIEWADESLSKQKEEYLFGAFTRRDKHFKDGYILAIDHKDKIYKPARTISVLNDGTLDIEYINLSRNERNSSPRTNNVPAVTTFVITEEYLDTIINILRR